MRSVLVLALLLIAPSGVAASDARLPGESQMAAFAEQLLGDTYPADGPGAAVLVVRGEQVLYRGARGLASVELGVPLAPEHAFRIGSVTKQFTAASILKLVEAGKLALDDPLSKLLPDFPNGPQISVRQLLAHTSGIKSYTDLPAVMGGLIRQDLSTPALIASFKDQPVAFAPGAQWAYNNSGYVLLGAVIETLSGKPWHGHLQDAVLAPAGLKHTVYGANDRLIPQMAAGYTVKDGALAPAAFMSMTQAHAAGALVSTVDDLHAWNLALHGGQLLSADSYAAMTTPAAAAVDSGYGFGLVRGVLRGHVRFEHGGGIFGYAADLVYVPDAQLSVVVLQNADATRNGKGDPQRLAALLGAFALGDPYYQETDPIKLTAEELDAAQGVYRMDADNARILRVVDGQLTAQRTGNERLALIPVAADRFLYQDSLTWLQLERSADGTISGIRVFHDGEGEGEFTACTDEALPVEHPVITLDEVQTARLLGHYLAGGMRLQVSAEDGVIQIRLDQQPDLVAVAQTPSLLFVSTVAATLEFAPESGAVQTVTLHQDGQTLEFKRSD